MNELEMNGSWVSPRMRIRASWLKMMIMFTVVVLLANSVILNGSTHCLVLVWSSVEGSIPRNSVKFHHWRLITLGWERGLSHPPVAHRWDGQAHESTLIYTTLDWVTDLHQSCKWNQARNWPKIDTFSICWLHQGTRSSGGHQTILHLNELML